MSEIKLSEHPEIHGALVEFDTPEALIEACEKAYSAGFRNMDAYAPMPVEGLAEAIGFKKNKVALVALSGGVFGAIGGFTLLEWITNVAYAHNIGGRPTNSWPAFIPITFECMILATALIGVTGMLLMNGLPQLYHPVFNVAAFQRASIDKFFLCIESSDPKFQPKETTEFLESLGGKGVNIVPA